MTGPIPLDINKGLDTVAKATDNLTTTNEEIQKEITQRHVTDMASTSWLSKNIRPIAFIFALVCQGALIGVALVYSWYGKEVDPWIVGQVGTLLTITTGFYFNSKKGEKIAFMNAEAFVARQNAEVKAKEIEVQLEKAREKTEIQRIKRMQKKLDRLTIKEKKQELKEK